MGFVCEYRHASKSSKIKQDNQEIYLRRKKDILEDVGY